MTKSKIDQTRWSFFARKRRWLHRQSGIAATKSGTGIGRLYDHIIQSSDRDVSQHPICTKQVDITQFRLWFEAGRGRPQICFIAGGRHADRAVGGAVCFWRDLAGNNSNIKSGFESEIVVLRRTRTWSSRLDKPVFCITYSSPTGRGGCILRW